jgi:anti-anti-sigma factor
MFRKIAGAKIERRRYAGEPPRSMKPPDGAGGVMKIAISEFGELGTKVTLVGRLDIAGADAIDLPLATVAGRRGNVVIDMAGVEFLASIGIHHLVTAAKAIARGAGRLVLLDPSPIVTEVLVTAGLDPDWMRSCPLCGPKTRRGRGSRARQVPDGGNDLRHVLVRDQSRRRQPFRHVMVLSQAAA